MKQPPLLPSRYIIAQRASQSFIDGSLFYQARTEFAETQELVQALREKDDALQRTFAEIDRLETVVQTVKETYNKVAASVEDMERSVGASLESRSFSPFSFRLVSAYVVLFSPADMAH